MENDIEIKEEKSRFSLDKKIIKTWNSLQNQIKEHNITKEMLLNDEFSQWAVTTPLYNIGEQVYKISDEMKRQNPQIIWSVVSGLRHRRHLLVVLRRGQRRILLRRAAAECRDPG